MLLFTGKGGVGKTTVAGATAVHAALHGHRVLLTSTDPAHSLADAFDAALGDAACPVGPPGGDAHWPGGGSLDAQQIDAQSRLERHWQEVRDYLVAVLAWGGMAEVQAEELVLLPGLDELFALIDLTRQVDSGCYDLVVVDCAPTAETMRLLTLPDALHWYVERVLGPSRRVVRAVRPLARGLSSGPAGVPLPDDEVFTAVDRINRDLGRVHALLQDPTRATIRLVVNPERLVIAETQRTATSLGLFGYGVDAVVVNRLLPEEITDPYLQRWKQRQAEHLDTVRRGFAPTPVLTAPLFDDELSGAQALRRLGSVLYGGLDAAAVLHAARTIAVEANGDGYLLRLALPFAVKDDLDLLRQGGDLLLRVGGVRRTVALPAVLRRCEVAGARLEDGWLEVRFAPAVLPSAAAGP